MRSIAIKPVTGYLDMRSNPQDVPQYRYVQNWCVETKSKLCRMPGWVKLLDRTDFNNHDLRDQLESISGVTGRRPWTFIFEASSQNKSKMLLIGHDRTLFGLTLGTGNYRVLNPTPMGADGETRWYATQNMDTVILTNDYDPPVYWTFDAATVAPIDDLATLGITRAGVVVTWSGCTFYMNVVENGSARTNRIIWSDYERPLSLIPSDDSTAGDAEVDSQESILAAVPLGNVLMIYTTKGIWTLAQTGEEGVFGVAPRYATKGSGEACLAYKNSLVSTGEEHLYMGQEGIYSYSLFLAKPKLVEWIHRASSVIYDEIDRARCDWQIAAYDPGRMEIWYSWVKEGDLYPVRTLVCNTEYPFSAIVDHGFTAFGHFQPNEPVTTLAQWILDNCICDSEEFLEVFGETENEGGQCIEPDAVVCESQPDSFFTTVELELEDDIVMEDWNEVDSTENSLCALLAGTTISSLCVAEAKRDQCNAGRLFVMASADDFCLKQMSSSFYREVCTGFTGCGTYEIVGYKSILRSGPVAFKDFSNEKQISRFAVEAIAVAALIPGEVAIRIGESSVAADPNDESCGIVWITEDSKSLECVAGLSASHAANVTRPDDELEWPTMAVGRYLYYELTVQNPDSTPVDVGASVCFSSYMADIEGQPARR